MYCIEINQVIGAGNVIDANSCVTFGLSFVEDCSSGGIKFGTFTHAVL
jgi:hypothetical protein